MNIVKLFKSNRKRSVTPLFEENDAEILKYTLKVKEYVDKQRNKKRVMNI